jgi:hypothetical protein
MSAEDFLGLMRKQRDWCHDCMEGTDSDGLVRWGRLYDAYSTIVKDLEMELAKKPTPSPAGGEG